MGDIGNKKDRYIYLDILRILATIGVVVGHLSAQYWESIEIGGYSWNVFTLYGGIIRWCVPDFMMISGALILSRDIPISKIYKKYCLRMVVTYFTWSLLYYIFADLANSPIQQVKNLLSLNAEGFVNILFAGFFHMWFIPMITGMYMCVPLLRQIVKEKSYARYFIILSLVFVFIIPQIDAWMNDFEMVTIRNYFNIFNRYVGSLQLNTIMGCAGYFIIGWYLNKYECKKMQRILIYILGILGAGITLLCTYYSSVKYGISSQTYYATLRLNLLMMAVAMFVLVKNIDWSFLEKFTPFISKLSKWSFGVYLVHLIVIGTLYKLGIDTLMFNPLYCVPVMTVVVTVFSFAISALLNKIPIVNKYIV